VCGWVLLLLCDLCAQTEYYQEKEELTDNDEIGLEGPSDDDSPRSSGQQTPPDIRSSSIRSKSARDLSLGRSKQRGSSGLLHVRAPPS